MLDILDQPTQWENCKACRTCFEVKNYLDFSKDKSKKDGLSTQCKACYREYHRINAIEINARRQRNHVSGKKRDIEYGRQWYKQNYHKVKAKHLKAKYGISLDDFNRLVETQNGQCKICKSELIIGRHTHVDHCHKTGIVRGILCQTCNTKLGWFEKNQYEVVKYLKEFT